MTETAPVVLITGSARRIGAAIARHFHACGWSVVLHAHTSSGELQQLAFDLDNQRPGSVLALQADLADATTLPDLVEQAVAHFGRLDALVNNASNFFPTPLGQITAEAMDALYAVNARAPLLLAQAAAPHLRRQQGSIVNLTDLHGTDPMRDHAAYTMAKAALEMATRALALELAPKVRVNAVAPGAILWPEQGKDDFARQALLQRTPLARTGTVEEIAEAVYWLVAEAHFVTGHTLRVDGGRTVS
ncbi:pteridine reductase [Stenotrophomonas sp. 24(2023)]|uniref:pteridine reductase n=1 Tax=Stenotrophomonas sp. 24(2023) TaxID=3068324 RepID=UPI0027E0520D|nr:pteridine reductase [Stenotrophomonas sp. 24(2023)]WMJ70501.1 pteridine reductase [Stenotrophomonas sp. 24(2023)]